MKKRSKKFFIISGGVTLLTAAVALTTVFALQRKRITELTKKIEETKINSRNVEKQLINNNELTAESNNKNLAKLRELFLILLNSNFSDSMNLLKKIQLITHAFFSKHDFETKNTIIRNKILKINDFIIELNNFESKNDQEKIDALNKFNEFSKETNNFVAEIIENLKNQNEKILREFNSDENSMKHSDLLKRLKNLQIDIKKAETDPKYLQEKIDELKTILNISEADLEGFLSKIKGDIVSANTEMVSNFEKQIKDENIKYETYLNDYLKDLEALKNSSETNSFKRYSTSLKYADKNLEIVKFTNAKDLPKTLTLKLENPAVLKAFKLKTSLGKIEEIIISVSPNNKDFTDIYSIKETDEKELVVNLETEVKDVQFIRFNIKEKEKSLNILNIETLKLFSNEIDKKIENDEDEKLVVDFWKNVDEIVKMKTLISNKNLDTSNLTIYERITKISESMLNFKKFHDGFIKLKESKNKIDIKIFKSEIQNLKNVIENLKNKLNDATLNIDKNDLNLAYLNKLVEQAEENVKAKDKELKEFLDTAFIISNSYNENIEAMIALNKKLEETKILLGETESRVEDLHTSLRQKDEKITALTNELKEIEKKNKKLENTAKTNHVITNQFVPFLEKLSYSSGDISKFSETTHKVHSQKILIRDFGQNAKGTIVAFYYDKEKKSLESIKFDENYSGERIWLRNGDDNRKTVDIYEKAFDISDNSYFNTFVGNIYFKIVHERMLLEDGKLYLVVEYLTSFIKQNLDGGSGELSLSGPVVLLPETILIGSDIITATA